MITIGNPVRTEIAQFASASMNAWIRRVHHLRLLVLGGSLGAQALNDVVPRALAQLS